MNEKPTVPNRKIQDLYFAPSHVSREERHSEYLEEELCLEHASPIEYVCFSCSNKVLCTECLSNGEHVDHDLKNIERSQQLLKKQLEAWSIRLQSKSDLLELLYDQIRSNSAEVHEFAEMYKQTLANEFEKLVVVIKERQKILTDNVNKFSRDYKEDCHVKLQKINTRKLQLNKMTSIIKNKVEKSTVQHQAMYYSQKRIAIDKLLDQAEINFYKQQYVQPSWGVDPQTFKKIENSIQNITVNFKYPEPYKDCFQLRQTVKQNQRKSSKKSKKDLRLTDTQKHDRQSNKGRYSNANSTVSPFLATFTPKGSSKQKLFKSRKNGGETLLKKRKKSSNKIVSMPASPERQHQFSGQKSPSKSRKNLFKKK